MLLPLRKIFFTLIYNSCLFLFLIIGIQNSSNKNRVNLLIDKTIDLPISFIVGTSFISGSILSGLFDLTFSKKK